MADDTMTGAAGDDPAPDDATAGADATAPDAGTADQVLVTISKTADGYSVLAGDEPEPGEAPEAGEAAPEPVQCKTIGEALKAALDILNGGEGGDEGTEQDFQSGYDSDKAPLLTQKS